MKDVKEFSYSLASKASKEAETYPVDRFFLKDYIGQITLYDRNAFIIQNLNENHSLYVTYLLLCLPELWNDMTTDDLHLITSSLENESSIFTFILFTYKFIEINIIPLVFEVTFNSKNLNGKIAIYLKNRYTSLIKTDTDYFFFDAGLYGVKNEDWMYVKQKLLLDNRITPALMSLRETKKMLNDLIGV